MTHSFDSSDASQFRKRIVELLAPLEKEFGAKVTVGNTVYGNVLRTKVELHKIDESGVDKTEEQRFKSFSNMYGVPPEMFNQVVKINGKEYQLIGMSTRSDKYPFMALELSTKKTWKMSAEMVKRGITKNKE